MELYKKHRPKSLDQVVGNAASVATLQAKLKSGKLPHTILFDGPSGCGKTTLGRIVRKELGCSVADYKEMNCSDFRGIDTIREIMKNMTLAPIGGKVRVWLLDEVHQLSKDGQNAALKMLEDTPKHVYFILCTTDPQKLLKTITNRCMRLPVEALDDKEMEQLLKRVCKAEGIVLSDDERDDLMMAAQGSSRSALVMLDKIAPLSKKQRAQAFAKGVDENSKEVIDLCRALLSRRSWKEVCNVLKGVTTEEPESVRWAVLGYMSAVLGSGKGNDQAFHVICCFENHFYDSKRAGLVRACYEAVAAK